MIKKYLAKHHSGKIVAVDVLRETDWSVFITSGSGTEQVIAKRTDHESYHDSFEAAREALRGRFLADLAHAEHRVSTTKAKLVALDNLEVES